MFNLVLEASGAVGVWQHYTLQNPGFIRESSKIFKELRRP